MHFSHWQGRQIGTGVYASCKAAIIALSKTAAKEWANVPIRCNIVMPGVIATPMVATADPVIIQHALEHAFMDRMGTPEGNFTNVIFQS